MAWSSLHRRAMSAIVSLKAWQHQSERDVAARTWSHSLPIAALQKTTTPLPCPSTLPSFSPLASPPEPFAPAWLLSSSPGGEQMETGSPPLSACVSCHRSFHQGYTLGLVPGQGAGLCPEWDDGPEQPSTISDAVWPHGIPSREPSDRARGGTGRNRVGKGGRRGG